MTRVALTKLLILGIIVFLICLPQFFNTYKVEKVKLSCLPCGPCDQESQVRKADDEEHGWTSMCDFNETTRGENWLQACVQKVSHPESDTRGATKNTHMRWFTCKTCDNMMELQSSISSPAYLEVMVEIKLRDEDILNITLYGRNNRSSLQLHLPEAEEDDNDHVEAFYCCVLHGKANKSCLLWLSNQTLFIAADKEAEWEQQDDWHCLFRVLWLVLLCVVLLSMVSAVFGRIHKKGRRRKKPTKLPGGHNLTGMLLKDKGNYTSMQTPNGRAPHTRGSLRLTSSLSPIQEVEAPDDIETLLDGNNSSYNSAHLHHRSHSSSSTSGDTEEQTCGGTAEREKQPDRRTFQVFQLCLM